MKLSKKLTAMVLCGIMTVSSVIGVGASAVYSDNSEETIIAEMSLEEFANSRIASKYNGIYYNESDEASFITVSTNSDDSQSIVVNRVYAQNNLLIKGSAYQGHIGSGSSSITGSSGCYLEFPVNYYYYYSQGNWVSPPSGYDTTVIGNVTVYGYGTYQYAKINITNSLGDTIQTFVQQH